MSVWAVSRILIIRQSTLDLVLLQVLMAKVDVLLSQAVNKDKTTEYLQRRRRPPDSCTYTNAWSGVGLSEYTGDSLVYR